MRRPVKVSPEPAEVIELRQQCDREVYSLRRELSTARGKLIDADKAIARQRLYREGAQMLVGMVARYQRAIQALGWSPPDDELALVEKIRKDLET